MAHKHLLLWTTGISSVLSFCTAATAQSAAPSAASEEAQQLQETSSDIIVTGIRKSLQDSIDTKRRANSIVDVISAEAVGKFPDSNVAESLSHLPGVTVDHTFGEGEQVSIAGTEPALNRILIDGHSIASANWGGTSNDRSSRSFNYSLLSPEIISQAVLYKTPEARLQEGAIGGSVDIVTRKPLDLKPHTLTASIGYEYNDRSNKGNVRGSALYSWHNADDTIAILGSVNYDKENLARAGVAIYGYQTGANLLGSYPTDADGNIIYNADGTVTGGAKINGATATRASIATLSSARLPSFLAHEYFQQVRERMGFNGTAQVKPADNFTLTANAIVIRGNYDNYSNSEYSYNVRGALLQSATITNGLITEATYGAGTGTNWTGQLDTNFRRTRIKNDTFSALFDWDLDGWKIAGNGGYTRASGGKDPEYLLNFRTLQGFTVGANGRNTTLNWDNPASDATQWVSTFAEASVKDSPAIRAANNGQSYFGAQIGGVTGGADLTLDREKFGQVDFSRDVAFGPVTKVLFGVRASIHDNEESTINGQVYTSEAFTLADLGSYVLADDLYDGLSTTGNGTPYATLSATAMKAALQRSGTLTVISSTIEPSNYFNVEERIATGYLQANFETGKFRGNIGGRVVRTQDISRFFATYTYKVNSSDPNSSTISTTTLTRVEHNDDRFLPAFNIAYDAGETVVLRASAAKVMARPRYSQLAGALSLDDVSSSGSLGNPDLKPYAATNFGASAEWYFAPTSYLSGELFYRDISNYITNSNTQLRLVNPLTGVTRDYAVSQPQNGGKATVTGFSLTAQANVIWGFGIQTNYTFTDADTGINGQGLPFLSRNTINVVPYFERGPIQARVSYNRRSKYFYQFGRLSSADYTDAYRQLDLSASYKFTPNIIVTANASNLLDETYYQYSQTKDAPTAIYKNGRVVSINASFRM